MAEVRTHLGIDAGLCGVVEAASAGAAVVALVTQPLMAADVQGLVHGGFVFGAADYAAMVAVNDPYVVLGSSECRFVAPVRVGERVLLTAQLGEVKGRKRVVEVVGAVGEREVFRGTFTTFVLDKHVLGD